MGGCRKNTFCLRSPRNRTPSPGRQTCHTQGRGPDLPLTKSLLLSVFDLSWVLTVPRLDYIICFHDSHSVMPITVTSEHYVNRMTRIDVDFIYRTPPSQ